DPARHDGLERLADQRREAGVRVQDLAATGEDDGAFLHLFDEVSVRLFGAMQRVDLAAGRALNDQRIDLALPDRSQHVLGFRETRAQRVLGLDGTRLSCDHRLPPRPWPWRERGAA